LRARWIFALKDYLRYRLTGEAFAEITNMSGSGLLNTLEARIDPDLLREYGLEGVGDKLPPLCGSTDLCGSVSREAARATGLLEGTPVAGGMWDIDAAAVATGVIDEGMLNIVAGTKEPASDVPANGLRTGVIPADVQSGGELLAGGVGRRPETADQCPPRSSKTPRLRSHRTPGGPGLTNEQCPDSRRHRQGRREGTHRAHPRPCADRPPVADGRTGRTADRR